MDIEEYTRYKTELIKRLKQKLDFWNIDHYIGKKEGQVIVDTMEYINAQNEPQFIDIKALKTFLISKGYQWEYVNSMISVVNDFNKHFNKVISKPENIYVRTKDRIIDVTNWHKDDKGYYRYKSSDFLAPRLYIYEKDIEREANNILLLLDMFVITDSCGVPHNLCPLNRYDYILKTANSSNAYAKGVIFTSKGIIYVAKVNNKGKLELIDD